MGSSTPAHAPEPADSGGAASLAGVPDLRSCPVNSAEGGANESRRPMDPRRAASALGGVLVSISGGAAGEPMGSSLAGDAAPAPTKQAELTGRLMDFSRFTPLTLTPGQDALRLQTIALGHGESDRPASH